MEKQELLINRLSNEKSVYRVNDVFEKVSKRGNQRHFSPLYPSLSGVLKGWKIDVDMIWQNTTLQSKPLHFSADDVNWEISEHEQYNM